MLSQQIRYGLPEDLIPLIIQYACVSPSAEALYKYSEKKYGYKLFETIHVTDDEDGNEVPLTEEDWELMVLEHSNKPTAHQSRFTFNIMECLYNNPSVWFKTLMMEGLRADKYNQNYNHWYKILELSASSHSNSKLLARQYAWRVYKKLTDCPTCVH
tara:strand:+ start:123 stop:593 length:471 start_codon:yes stop_codon:yes gene_type:complete